jgi:hypothetical protein
VGGKNVTTGRATKEFCRTELAYIPRDGSGTLGPVPIFDGRRAELPGWQECGFELMQHASDVNDWSDDAEIASVHYAEVSELARLLSGCDHALVASHIKRNPDEAKKHSDLSPIRFVHSDFADSYGDLLRELYRSGDRAEAAERDGLSPEDIAGARRLMILQFWRNLGPAKMDLPLAFCDSRTIPRDEIRPIPVKNYAGSGFDFEALGIVAPASADDHHWYVFPEMTIDEVVAFRTYDTDLMTRGEHYWTPHSAIRDPEVEPGKPSRSSIELRATCLFM